MLVATPGRPGPWEAAALHHEVFVPGLATGAVSGLSFFKKSGKGLVFNLTGDHDEALWPAEGLYGVGVTRLCVEEGNPVTPALGAWGRRTLEVDREVVLEVGVNVDENPSRLVSSQDALRPSHCDEGWLLMRVMCRVDTIARPPARHSLRCFSHPPDNHYLLGVKFPLRMTFLQTFEMMNGHHTRN